MDSLKSIHAAGNADLQLIYTARTLEAVLREIEAKFVAENLASVSLGDLVQRRKAFLGEELLRDVNFALGVRNSVAHINEKTFTAAERTRAVKYLVAAIELHVPLLPKAMQTLVMGMELRSAEPSKSKRVPASKPSGTTSVPKGSRPVAPSPAPPAPRPAPSAPAKPASSGSFGLLGSVLVAGLAFGVWWWWGSQRPGAVSSSSESASPAPVTRVEQLAYDWLHRSTQSGDLRHMCLTADGDVAVILETDGDNDSVLKIWSTIDGSSIVIGHIAGRTHDVALTADGAIAATISSEGVKVWDTRTRACRFTLPPNKHLDDIVLDLNLGWKVSRQALVAITPDGRTLVSAVTQSYGPSSTPNAIEIQSWDTATGKCLNTLYGHNCEMTGLAVSADGTRIASCSKDGVIKVWHGKTKATTITLPTQRIPINVAFVPGQAELMATLLVGDNEGTIVRRVVHSFDVNDGRQVTAPDANVGGEFLACSRDGQLIVAGPCEGKLHVVDRNRGRNYAMNVINYDHRLRDIAVSADAKTVAWIDCDKHFYVARSK